MAVSAESHSYQQEGAQETRNPSSTDPEPEHHVHSEPRAMSSSHCQGHGLVLLLGC